MRRAKLELYRDAGRDWRWRLKASNGRILADSGEGYCRRAAACKALARVREILAGHVLIEEVSR